MSNLTRRSFIKGAATVAAAAPAVLAAPTSAWAKPMGANDDIRVAVVGFRSQGGGHIKRFLQIPGVRVVGLCDPDSAVLERELQAAKDRKEKVEGYTDVRQLLENPDIDAISTASPNHWHALISIWACQAGKDVYVEKPCSHNVWEGRKIVEAARKYDRIVQIGTQNRSNYGLAEALKWLQEGNLGKITLSRGLCYKPRQSIGKVSGPQRPPATVDYSMWTGPAPLGPLIRKNLHYDWHWVWDTGNGDLGNQGIHEMDIARWALGVEHLSPRVMSIGGRFGYDDDGETANTQIVYHDYDGVPLIFEVRGLPNEGLNWDKGMPSYKGVRIGNIVHCEGGYFAGGWAYDNDGKKVKQFDVGGGADHQPNFIKAVRSHKVEDLNADIEKGHLSSALCHTGNISYRLGKTAAPEEIEEHCAEKEGAMETFERFREHLSANGVDLAKEHAALGPMLKMDPKTERFTGLSLLTRKANKMLTREYREPFVVPENV